MVQARAESREPGEVYGGRNGYTAAWVSWGHGPPGSLMGWVAEEGFEGFEGEENKDDTWSFDSNGEEDVADGGGVV